MTDWGTPEVTGTGAYLTPEFNVFAPDPLATVPAIGRIHDCRVNTTPVGRYLASDQAGVAGLFRVFGLPPDTVVFNAIDADGVDHGALFASLNGSPCTVDWQLEGAEAPCVPTWTLGPLDVFADPAELRPALGAVTGEANERRLRVALLAATRHVLHVMGYAIDEDSTIPIEPDPLAVVVVPVRSSWRQATIAAAVRFYKSPEVPFGVAGGWDMATYVRMSIPDVDLLLLGQRVRFGIA